MTEDMKKKKNTNNIRKYLPWDIFLQSHILRYKHAAGEFLDLVSDNKILGHRKGDSLGLNQTVGNDGGDFLGLNTGVVLFNLTRWDDLSMNSYALEMFCFSLDIEIAGCERVRITKSSWMLPQCETLSTTSGASSMGQLPRKNHPLTLPAKTLWAIFHFWKCVNIPPHFNLGNAQKKSFFFCDFVPHAQLYLIEWVLKLVFAKNIEGSMAKACSEIRTGWPSSAGRCLPTFLHSRVHSTMSLAWWAFIQRSVSEHAKFFRTMKKRLTWVQRLAVKERRSFTEPQALITVFRRLWDKNPFQNK